MLNTLKFSNRITSVTLISYLLGLLVLQNPILSFIFISTLCYLLHLLSGKYSIFYQHSSTLIQIVITMYIFGFIHIYSYYTVIQFIHNKQNQAWPLLQIYLSFMCVYYYFQFQLNNCFHHAELNWYSFLIYHSKQYLIANAFSLTEHLVAKYLIGFGYKNTHFLIYPALIFMILGEGLRIAAFFTAKSNFTHLVRYKKDPKHQLITHGVYSFFRHPSYTGYFYFSVSSQLFLGNWISAIGFFIVLSKFFNGRIEEEELFLASFFQKYLYYKKKTHILIPFVKDPSSEEIMKELIRSA